LYGVDAWKHRPGNDAIPGGETYAKWNMDGLKRHVTEGARKYGDRAIVLNMETTDAAALVPDGSLDCVFIDADHTSEGVRRDIENWRPKIRPGGFITGHDADWDSVRVVIDKLVPGWKAAVDNVWWART
jgi:predicted O-methyltransferase YrrM